MISELPGAGPTFADVARQQGLFDKMRSAPGFMGHWSGASDTGYRVFEVWESPEAHQVWLDGTVKPSLPLGAEPVAGLHRAARADPAELTGRHPEIGDGVRYCSSFPAQPGHQRPAAGWAAASPPPCATDFVEALVPAPVDAPVLAQSASAAGRHGDAACAPHRDGRAASPPDSAEKARRERRANSACHWHGFLTDLEERGLASPLLIISDGAPGLIAAIEQAYPKALRQRCLIHRARTILAKVPAGMQAEVKDAYWKVFDTEDLTTPPGPKLTEITGARITEMAARYSAPYPSAMKCPTTDAERLTAYLRFPAGQTPAG